MERHGIACAGDRVHGDWIERMRSHCDSAVIFTECNCGLRFAVAHDHIETYRAISLLLKAWAACLRQADSLKLNEREQNGFDEDIQSGAERQDVQRDRKRVV